MKLYIALISAVLVLCLGAAYATANPINCGSGEGYHTTMNIERFVAMNSNESSSDPTAAANMSASVSNAVSLISSKQ